MMSVNLIPRAKRLRQQARRRREQWIRFLRFYAIVLAGGCALALLPAHAALPSLDSSIARIDRRIETTTKALDQARRQLGALGTQLDLARAVGEHPDWSILLGAIARARADDAVLESFDLTLARVDDKSSKSDAAKPPAPNAKPLQRDIVVVKLTGLCSSPASCFQFAHALEQLELFERVVVKDTRSQPLGAMPATRFEIEAIATAAPVPLAAPTAPAKPRPTTGGEK